MCVCFLKNFQCSVFAKGEEIKKIPIENKYWNTDCYSLYSAKNKMF